MFSQSNGNNPTIMTHRKSALPRNSGPPLGIASVVNSPKIGEDYHKYMASGQPRERIGADHGVFRNCEGYNCDLPYIPCNHATPPLMVMTEDSKTGAMKNKSNWKTFDYFTFIGTIVSQNVCYLFILAYLLIEYAPQNSVDNLLFYAIGRGGAMFFLNMRFAEKTGAYVNPLITLMVWATWWLTYATGYEDKVLGNDKKSDDNGKADMPPAPAGWELLKGVIVLVFSFGGLLLGILFLWITFLGTGGLYAGFNFGSPVFAGASTAQFTNGVALSTWQGVVREGLATFILTGTILFAHSDPRVRNSSILAAFHIGGAYAIISWLFGQTTNAIMNPFYWIVTRIFNISGGDAVGFTVDGFLVYFIGPLAGAVAAFLFYLIMFMYLQWSCSQPECVVYN